MQVGRVNLAALDFEEYLRLDNRELERRRSSTPLLLYSAVGKTGVAAITVVAPTDRCWGVEFAFSDFAMGIHDEVARRLSADQLSSEIVRARRKPDQIVAGLLPLPPDSEGQAFDYGAQEALQPWWFRSYLVPEEVAVLDEFTRLWAEYTRQLSHFFCMPYTDARVRDAGPGACFAPWKLADTLDRLFCSRVGPRGADATELLSLLERSASNREAAHSLDASLTPEFLLQECVRWDNSLVWTAPGLQQATLEAVREIGGNSQIDVKLRIAMLRIAIASLLGWPLGVRQFRRKIEVIPIEARRGSDLCRVTELYVDDALERFPVLKE